MTDVLKAYKHVVMANDRDALNEKLKKLFHPQSIVCLSARTALDAWLRVNNFPKGSEISLVMSAVNIPDMSKVIRESGLIPVPVDIEFDTMFPTPEAVEAAITPKTVAVLIAQLYGRRCELDGIAAVTKKHNIPLIEDLAEGYGGPKFTGSPLADLALFSFGPIKFNTSFGGGIVVIRDKAMFQRVEAFHNTYTIRSKSEMLQKLIKYMIPMLLLNVPMLSGFLMNITTKLGIDHKAYVVSMLRGFPDKFFEKLRQRPDPALLAILEERLANFDPVDHSLSARNGDLLTKTLLATEKKLIEEEAKKKLPYKGPVLIVPGQACAVKNYWLYPLIVEDPSKTMAELNNAGIDSYRGATQLNLVDRPQEYKDMKTPQMAKQIMDHTIYIPVHKAVSEKLVKKLGQDIAVIARRINQKPVFEHSAYIKLSNTVENLPRGQLASAL